MLVPAIMMGMSIVGSVPVTAIFITLKPGYKGALLSVCYLSAELKTVWHRQLRLPTVSLA